MSVRRPKPVFEPELPLRASPVERFMPRVESALNILDPMDEEHRSKLRSQLARIARDYADSRRHEARKADRSEVRVTLECVGRDAAELQSLVTESTAEDRNLMGRIVRANIPASHACLGPDFATILEELDISADLRTAAERLAQKLWRLPTRAEWLLVELQQYAPFSTLLALDDAELGSAFFRRLSDLAFVAAEVMKTERGPKSDVPQMIAVDRLRAVYEGEGLSVTHNAKVGRNYGGELESPFGRFVKIVLGGLNSRNDMGLADAVSFACWPSRSRLKASKVDEQRNARAQLITRFLQSRGVAIFSPQAEECGL